MMLQTLRLRGALVAAVLLISGAAPALGQAPRSSVSAPAVTPEVRKALAPSGKLRVAVYDGGPSSMVQLASGEKAGVAFDLGAELGRRLGVPVELVQYERVAQVVDALKAGAVDFSVTNATPARTAVVDYTAPIIDVELGYLVVPGSPVKTIADVDKPGVRIGVLEGSTSLGALTALYKNARVLTAPSLEAARNMLTSHTADAYATNKSNLNEMSDQLPGSHVLDGNWGFEHMGIGVPKGRDVGFAYIQAFAAEAKASGAVARAAHRAGLRGAVGL